MNKYELALVVSAKVDDEVRNATVENQVYKPRWLG